MMINKNMYENQQTNYIIHKKHKKNLAKITFYSIYAFIAIWLLFNGSSLPYWNTSWTTNTIIYLISVTIVLNIDLQYGETISLWIENTYHQNRKHNYNRLLWITIVACATFIITLLLFWLLYDLGLYFTSSTPLNGKYYTSYLPYHFFIVVCSETIIFQGVLYRLILFYTENPTTAIILSAVGFSIFHTLAYSGNIYAFLMAFLLGVVFAYGTHRLNIGFPLGMHLTYNGMILGFLIYKPMIGG